MHAAGATAAALYSHSHTITAESERSQINNEQKHFDVINYFIKRNNDNQYIYIYI